MVGLFDYIWRNSRAEQARILCIVLLSLPFYYLSLELPKYIISDALQGRAFAGGQESARLFHLTLALPEWLGGPRVVSPGVQFDRLAYLLVLSGLFLLLVLTNGGFKYIINMRKGAMGERLLQQLRFDLFSALLRFKPEALQRIKPSEAATIIKDEVEPIGGFVGDAFVQPVFLGGQALTALAFILVQNVALGLIALAMVLLQGAIIPRLRREQIRLGKERQIVSRAFAGKIGEVVETIGEVGNHGTEAVEKSQVAQRLEVLFGIRYRLYGRKFAVKMLNNLLAQVTPFLFYAVGGSFALAGRLEIGQLVAVIVAYRDLPPPVKELIDWDQQRLDVEAKFQQVVEQFTLRGTPMAQEDDAGAGEARSIPSAGAIVAHGITVTNAAGDRLLDRINLSLPLGRHIALTGSANEGAGRFAQLLGGRLTASEGSLTIAGLPIENLSAETRGESIAYAGPEPTILDGTLRDNILYGLRRVDPGAGKLGGWSIDHRRANAASAAELEKRLVEVLRAVGLADTVFRLGLACKLEPGDPSPIVHGIADIRPRIRAMLAARGAQDAIEPYDPSRYTRNATIGENILFGVPSQEAFAGARLARHGLIRQVLAEQQLAGVLTGIGRRIAATMLDIFRDLPPGHVLFEQFSFIDASEFPEYRDILARTEAAPVSESDGARLIGLAFRYIEPVHRLGLLDEPLERRILAARTVFRQRAGSALAGSIAFYEPQRYCPAAPVRENLLFGLVAHGASNGREHADHVIREALAELHLDGDIYRLGLDQPAGYAGRLLFPVTKAQVAFARCLIKRPQLLILNNAFGPFGRNEARQVLDGIRGAMAGRTLIVAGGDSGPEGVYDLEVAFDGPRLARVHGAGEAAERVEVAAEPDGAPENAEVRVLRAVPIFSDLDTARLKLLAFTSERMTFATGDVLFRQGDESDAAYVLVAGTADIVIEADGGPVRISSVAENAIIGEMGIVTGEPRSATIVATSPIDALKLRKDVFLAVLAEFPTMALSVTRLMVKRLQDNIAAVTQSERDRREGGS